MEVEIRPEPSADERAAILVALEAELATEPDPRGPWWDLGLRESLAGGPVAPDRD